MASNYWLSAVVAYVSITALSFQCHNTKSIVGLGAEGECWICFVLMHRYPVDLPVIFELAIESQLSYVHQKVALHIPFYTAIIIIVAFLCAHHLQCMSCSHLLWLRAYFLLLQSRCVYYKCGILLTSYFNAYFRLECMPGSAIHLLKGSIPAHFSSSDLWAWKREKKNFNPSPLHGSHPVPCHLFWPIACINLRIVINCFHQNITFFFFIFFYPFSF